MRIQTIRRLVIVSCVCVLAMAAVGHFFALPTPLGATSSTALDGVYAGNMPDRNGLGTASGVSNLPMTNTAARQLQAAGKRASQGAATPSTLAIPNGDEQWDGRFAPPLFDAAVVYALAVSGTEVYAGGDFSVAGGVTATYVARWDGAGWAPLGEALDGLVSAIVISGSDVYAGGNFQMAGNTSVRNIARWDGSNWSPLGPGLNGGGVNAMVISGTILYVGGIFNATGDFGTSLANVAAWDGSAWAPLGSGVDNTVRVLAVGSNGLYVGGKFTKAGGNTAYHLARWDGTNWSVVGGGLGDMSTNIPRTYVSALAISGTEIYVGGSFTSTSTLAANNVAKWNGSSWSTLGSGADDNIQALTISGTTVIAGGAFVKAGGTTVDHLSSWSGSTWSGIGGGTSNTVNSLARMGADLLAGGAFVMAGNMQAKHIARWDGSVWTPFGSGVCCATYNSAHLNAVGVAGQDVYVGGYFTSIGDMPASNIARWNRTTNQWSSLGGGANDEVQAITVSGTQVYVGGYFTSIGGHPARAIARWNGAAWTDLAGGVNGDFSVTPSVWSIAISGTNVYVGGNFIVPGGFRHNIGRWNGTAWSDIGTGFQGGIVRALALRGSDIYAGGESLLYTGGVNPVRVDCLARWNGSAWSAVGSGLKDCASGARVDALAVKGSDLFVGGGFITVGPVQNLTNAVEIARWDGGAWATVGAGTDGEVQSLLLNGNDLYAGGRFGMMDGNSISGIAKWDGVNWSGLGSGIGICNDLSCSTAVDGLATNGRYVYAAGHFKVAGNKPSERLARWDTLSNSLYLPIVVR